MCFQKYSSLFLSLFFFFSRLLFRVLKSDEKQKKRKEKVTEMMEEILRINTPYTVHSHPPKKRCKDDRDDAASKLPETGVLRHPRSSGEDPSGVIDRESAFRGPTDQIRRVATVESDHAVRESAGVDHRWGRHEGDSIGRVVEVRGEIGECKRGGVVSARWDGAIEDGRDGFLRG